MKPCRRAVRPRLRAALPLLLLLLPAVAAHGKIVDGVVAVVDNQAVTFSEVRKAASEALSVDAGEADSILREEKDPAKVKGWISPLVDSLLVRRELSKAGQAVTEADLDRVVASIRAQNRLDEAAFRKALEGEGMTYDAYRARLRWQLERSALLRARKGKEISVTDEEAREWFFAQSERYAEGGEVRLDLLVFPYGESGEEKERVLPAHLAARAAVELLASGKRIEELPSLLSGRFPGVRFVAGGFVTFEDLPPEMVREVRRLRTGESSAPFFTAEGGRLAVLRERRGGKAPAFADVKEQVVEELTERRSEKAFADLMEELRRGAVVEYRF